MIIIGEKINSTLKAIRPAMENRDADAVASLARRQYEAGATYIDLNAGAFYDNEADILEWLVVTVQQEVDAPLSIDTPNPVALERALRANKNGKPIVNSITNEKTRYDSVLPLVKEFGAAVVALCMDDTGMPDTAVDRVKIADSLIEKLTKEGVSIEDIFIDPMVRPIGTGTQYGVAAIDTIRQVKQAYPEVHIACGLSNISYGIPARKVMNQTFLIAAMAAGMDGAILDPLDKRLMTFLYAGNALMGHDEYCMEYLKKFREGAFET